MRPKNYLLSGLALLTVFTCSSVWATLIKETWQGTVTDTSIYSSLGINDTFTWTVTFDNTSTRMHFYSDGVDGIAGTADDILDHTYCTDSDPIITGCDTTFIGPSFFADANFNISDLVSTFTLIHYDARTQVRAVRFDGPFINFQEMTYVNDTVALDLYSSGGTFLYYVDNTLSGKNDDLKFNYSLIRTEEISSPAPLTLMSLGLLGLLLTLRRNKT